MVWSHHDVWLLTGDHGGFVKYWQSNMNNVKMYEAHKEPIRGLRWATLSRKSSRQQTIWISLSVAIVSLPVFVEFLVLRVLKIIRKQLHFSLVQISVQDFFEILLYVLFNLMPGNQLILLDGYLLFVTGLPDGANTEPSNVLVGLLACFRLNKLFPSINKKMLLHNPHSKSYNKNTCLPISAHSSYLLKIYVQ